MDDDVLRCGRPSLARSFRANGPMMASPGRASFSTVRSRPAVSGMMIAAPSEQTEKNPIMMAIGQAEPPVPTTSAAATTGPMPVATIAASSLASASWVSRERAPNSSDMVLFSSEANASTEVWCRMM